MKKIILSLFVLLSLATFTQEKYQIEIEPSAKISQNVIQSYNSQIEKEVSKIYSKEEMFGLMNKMMNGVSTQSKNEANDLSGLMNGFFGENYVSKMMDTVFKYYKIEIEKINYISENKAYVKVKLGFPINMDEIKNMGSIDKMLEKAEESSKKLEAAFKKKTGKTMEKYSKSISEKDEKAMKKFFEIMGEIQMEIMDEEFAKITKNGKYVGRKEILEANKKNGKWVIENPNFGY
ncbi:hypothetical protein [Leptotrichia massiliensis]|uniref:hypothetical protein n=1 Tax=Leptotrichia massiliensis TaxID=1852388 RepID=UPI0028D22C36|nr:hypothetical protein [Leptotrichia massiliensis]